MIARTDSSRIDRFVGVVAAACALSDWRNVEQSFDAVPRDLSAALANLVLGFLRLHYPDNHAMAIEAAVHMPPQIAVARKKSRTDIARLTFRLRRAGASSVSIADQVAQHNQRLAFPLPPDQLNSTLTWAFGKSDPDGR